jgi:XTP/dITP diphosphohydrolase
MPPSQRRIVLVETSADLPGLLPFQAWDALGLADEVLVRDRDSHPSTPYLYAAGLDLVTVEPATLERADLDLTRPGSAEDRRLAKALVGRAVEGQAPVFLLGPDDDGLAKALAGMSAEPDVEIELVFLAPIPAGTELLRLVEVMRQLRDPQTGCPWDLEQDHATLLRYLLEETYELVDAIEQGSDVDLVEELGDVLLQIVFHAQVAQDRRAFGIDDVARGIVDKLVRRHPHVFADGEAATADDVQATWDQQKAREKGRTGPFEGVPDAMAGLMLVETVHRKATKRGVAGPQADAPAASVLQHLTEADDADSDEDREAALGALIGAVVSLADSLGVDPEAAARRAAAAFRARVERVLQLAATRGIDPREVDRATVLELWEAAHPDG